MTGILEDLVQVSPFRVVVIESPSDWLETGFRTASRAKIKPGVGRGVERDKVDHVRDGGGG